MPTSRSARKRFIAVTLGDPAGVGPEVTLKALAKLPKARLQRIILVGSKPFYAQLAGQMKLKFPLNQDRFVFDREVPVRFQRGRSDNELTALAVRSIEAAVALAMSGEAAAIVTPPINKAGLKRAGFNIPGHTEFLAKLSCTERFEMMLVGGKLRVALVTRHTPIARVSKLITRERVEQTILMTAEELKRSFGIRKPRIVVCGLNPHAGEEGTIGREEINVIRPAVTAAKKKTSAEIVGPLSPDALFHDAYMGRYDAEVCMYHDQGLIPLKMISRGAGVNVTLGLPFVRTSPDHGTAYDIAPFFKADPGSMLEAIELAFDLASRRRG
jgi:4-hydroxythreonine-4-phosphate dehydrogenase